MDKIELIVLGLSASPASNNAYALILKEANGEKRLPIIIGAFEAQAIALEMEGVVPPRPMTHDLLKKMIDAHGSSLSEVFINDLKDGTFFAKLRFDMMDVEIDARPSDAIALAVRCQAPIFVSQSILDETGHVPEDEDPTGDESKSPEGGLEFSSRSAEPSEGFEPAQKKESEMERLERQLSEAIENEDYENAAKLRDEIKKICDNQ